MGQQDLGLRREQQFAIKDAPVKRFFAEAVAGNKQTPAVMIPKREREHPVEVLDHFPAILLVKMRENFGVRSAAKGVPALFQIGAQFAIVVDLSVEDDGDAVIFVESRLL